MTSLTRHASPVRVSIALCLLLLVLPFVAGGAAQAGGDDFEFGQKLAEARFFDYARKVFDAILKNPNRSEEEKGEAQYGLALLRKEEAIAATSSADAQYADIVKLFDSAADDISDFVQKNPKNKNATQARLDVGAIRLAFVQWARELLEDEGAIADNRDRGFNVNTLAEDAQRSVNQAIEYFGGLRPPENEANPKPYQELASYYYVISQYYKALVEPPCSPSAISALRKAEKDLDAYIFAHDGQLLGIYAQDIYGLVFWERAKCEQDPQTKLDLYNKAFEWFETCIYTDDEGPDHQRIITSGYYHIAQAGLEAGRMPGRNFGRDALLHLETMLDRHPTAWRSDNGLRALVEWSKLECQRGNANKAVEVARDAAERAKTAGNPYLERLANRQLNDYVSGGCGGAIGGLDPEVLKRVADDLFSRQQYQEAVRAYRTVINSTSPTQQDFLAFRWHAWERMAQAYGQIDDRLGEALAYEPIHAAWMRGQIPFQKGQVDDQNMLRAGNNRRSGQKALTTLAEATGSATLQREYKAIQDSFLQDYPDHPSNRVGEWNAAIDKWKAANEQKRANSSKWKKTLAEARGHFENVAKDAKHERSDAALVYLIRCYVVEENFAEAVKRARKAFEYWNSPEAKKQAEEFDSIRKRREDAAAGATFWLAHSLIQLKKAEEALATLEGYHQKFPNVDEIYQQLAYDLLLQASLARGDIEEADKHYRTLLKRYPKYGNLPRITSDLAGHYNEQSSAIRKKLVDVSNRLNVAKKGFREADKKAFDLAALLADLNNRLKKANEAVKLWAVEKDKPANERKIEEGEYNEQKLVKEEMDKRIPEEKARLAEWAPKRDAFFAELTQLQTEQLALRQELYEPLVKAATYWRSWDDTLKKLEEKRDARNVAIFAGMFYNAAQLRPEVPGNWIAARQLFEDYLAFPQIKQRPTTDADKREAIANLGDVYVNLAEKEEDPEKRRALVTDAVGLLQQSLAEKAADNEIVVGMLADKLLVLSLPYRGKKVRFAIPRPSNVKEFRESVRTLGKPGGPPLPSFENEDEENEYKRALNEFRTQVDGMDDKRIAKKFIVESGKSTFDPYLYRELADSSVAFRLALSWAYSRTGRDEDVPKAVNLVLSLVAPPLGVEEDTEDWWRARAIQLRLYLDAGERRSTGGSTSTSDAGQWLERAGDVFRGIAANYPDLGERTIPGSQKQWLALLDRMNALRAKEGQTKITVELADLSKAPGDVEQPGDDEEGN